MSIISDKELGEEVIQELTDFRGYSEEEAQEWLLEYGEDLVSAMWAEYSSFIEQHAEYKGT
jgi:hypothetical protein